MVASVRCCRRMWRVATVYDDAHTPNEAHGEGTAHAGGAVQRKHLMRVKYSDRPNS